jgi:hypothetical protein
MSLLDCARSRANERHRIAVRAIDSAWPAGTGALFRRHSRQLQSLNVLAMRLLGDVDGKWRLLPSLALSPDLIDAPRVK